MKCALLVLATLLAWPNAFAQSFSEAEANAFWDEYNDFTLRTEALWCLKKIDQADDLLKYVETTPEISTLTTSSDEISAARAQLRTYAEILINEEVMRRHYSDEQASNQFETLLADVFDDTPSPVTADEDRVFKFKLARLSSGKKGHIVSDVMMPSTLCVSETLN